jgi:hypothetical protein
VEDKTAGKKSADKATVPDAIGGGAATPAPTPA